MPMTTATKEQSICRRECWEHRTTGQRYAVDIVNANNTIVSAAGPLSMAIDEPMADWLVLTAETLTIFNTTPQACWALANSIQENIKDYVYVKSALSHGDEPKKLHNPRPCKSVTIKPGKKFYVQASRPEGNFPGELWTVSSVSRTEITITSSGGETYRLIA